MTSFQTSAFGWYARRMSSMSAAELAGRGRDAAVKAVWYGRRVRSDKLPEALRTAPGPRVFTAVLPPGAPAAVTDEARRAVLTTADELLRGRWETLGIMRHDLQHPDWFYDPVTGRRAPADRYAFRIDHRSEAETGNVKHIWELSRLQHLTLLAAAWFLSHDEAYARRTVEHLQSWWQENPFLSGIHWTSGIEVGLRLISMTWIRRLLDDWPEAADCFERNELAVRQIWWHQRYLATLRSRGTSANNHVIAEAAGQLVASCAFPWFASSDRWRQQAARLLERELTRNTFSSGIGRELASGYQTFVAELGIVAGVEAAAAGSPLSNDFWQRLCAMIDSGAALLDARLRAPRQGDSDEGRALLIDAPAENPWPSLLALGEALFGRLDWWPETVSDAASSIVAVMAPRSVAVVGRPTRRPWHFSDAGITLLRSTSNRDPEIWCRCDGGPHGYLTIAAHAHADALSIEVRYGGLDVLADPGTYCYHGEPQWRSYFRSTIAHNTVELEGRDQSAQGGPFLWVRHANGRVVEVRDIGDAVEWTAEHDGYRTLDSPAWHRRRVRLDRASRTLDVVDDVTGASHAIRLAFHLGPEVTAELAGAYARLRWSDAGARGGALMELPPSLQWTLHRGEDNPVLGWYSSSLGRRTPAVALIGSGRTAEAEPLLTRLEFWDDARIHVAASTANRQATRRRTILMRGLDERTAT